MDFACLPEGQSILVGLWLEEANRCSGRTPVRNGLQKITVC
jgi:hypothetical protein